MAHRTPVRNPLAKPLPERWRLWLVSQGVPRRKYSAVLSVVLDDGQVVDEVVVEEGWIVAVGLAALQSDVVTTPIDLEPERIASMTLRQVI